MRRRSMAVAVVMVTALAQATTAGAAVRTKPALVPGTSPVPPSIAPAPSPSPLPPPVITPSGLGVPLGTPVTLRTSPDNNIVTAVLTAAARVGLGPVDVVNFSPDCSPIQGRVVVCRDITLQTSGPRTATGVGFGFCVVRLDPRVGGAPVGVNQVTRALQKCIPRSGRAPSGPFGPEG